jgi:hypothetical protein
MANEAAKPAVQAVPFKSSAVKVASMQLQEGGVQLPGLGVVHVNFNVATQWARDAQLDMELVRELGGVVVAYRARVAAGEARAFSALVPLAHVRLLELA